MGADSKTTHGKSNGKGAGVGGFQHLGLSPPIFRGVMAMGYKVPTPIQRKSLPIILSGKDVVAMARTGSGKTAAFLIPMLEKMKEHSKRIGVRALILSPTRELAVQTLRFAKSLSKFTNLKISLIVGGEGMEAQFEAISNNPDVIVATPGRLMHHLQEIPDFNLKSIEYLVFDEADRIFEMGFAEQLQEILKTMPSNRQTLLFSATLPKVLVQFARAGLNEPELIRLDVENKISENLKMTFFTLRSDDKPAIFVYLVRDFLPKNDQTIVFAATRHHVEFLHELLKAQGIDSSCVYGDMDQASRKINIGKFRAKKTNLLIVTDVAARGIDIPLLNNVLNYSFPSTAKLFVHRVGRAARAGRSGTAISFVDPDETPFMVDLHLYIGRRLEDSNPLKCQPYSLDEMTVQDIHYGALPNDLIDRETEYIRETLLHDPQVQPLVKVCANAYKMYARTRADPSKLSIRRAKEELLVKKIHPLFMGQISQENRQKVEYIEQLQTFRPSQTIFEIGMGAHSAKKNSLGVQMMQTKRKIHERIIQKTEETKMMPTSSTTGSTYTNLVSGSMVEERKDGDEEAETIQEDQQKKTIRSSSSSSSSSSCTSTVRVDSIVPVAVKHILSKYERKQLKKRVALGEKALDIMKEFTKKHLEEQEKAVSTFSTTTNGFQEKEEELEEATKSRSFRDHENYIGYMKQDDYVTEEFLSKAADGGKGNSFEQQRLEEAILDVNPDEAIEMNKKRRILHWDVRKKKYIKTTVGEIGNNGKHLKRRNESGTVVGFGGKKQKVGEIYKKWQQRQNKPRIFTGGEEADEETSNGKKQDYRNGSGGRVQRERINKHAKNELLNENAIRKEEKRKARSRGVKVPSKKSSKKGKGNIRGKSHGAPTRSKIIYKK